MQDTQPAAAHVYLEGDPSPLGSSLAVEQIAALIFDAEESGVRWVRVPLVDGREALVRPTVFAALVPAAPEEE
jgi:hypothetical protein